MSENIFRHSHRVTYGECTVGNHIYYGRYLELLEEARGEFSRQLGVTLLELQQQEIIFPVMECRIRYKAPARYDDLLTIEVVPTLAEGVRLNFFHRILNQIGTLVLEAETFHVCTGLNDKPKRLPAELIVRLEPFLKKAV
ncbi:MAG: acyl-CoA thioester hydrolase [Verrucomicrobiota bacterium]